MADIFPCTPRYDNNRLGASIGGPILKNKLFYFGNFEYNPVGQSAVPGSPLYAPTAAGYSTLASLPGINATNLAVFQKYVPAAVADQPSITVASTQIPIGSISFVSPTFTKLDRLPCCAIVGYYYVGSSFNQLGFFRDVLPPLGNLSYDLA
jgi:hypothetical protein